MIYIYIYINLKAPAKFVQAGFLEDYSKAEHCFALTFNLFWFYLYTEKQTLVCMHKYVRMISS